MTLISAYRIIQSGSYMERKAAIEYLRTLPSLPKSLQKLVYEG